jgi:hypothetical protein
VPIHYSIVIVFKAHLDRGPLLSPNWPSQFLAITRPCQPASALSFRSRAREPPHGTTSSTHFASSLCVVQHCSCTAHHRSSGRADRSPPQAVPWPRVDLSVQPHRCEEPHWVVLWHDTIVVSATGASTMTAFSNSSPVQPNRPRSLPHPRATRWPVNRRQQPVVQPLTSGNPSSTAVAVMKLPRWTPPPRIASNESPTHRICPSHRHCSPRRRWRPDGPARLPPLRSGALLPCFRFGLPTQPKMGWPWVAQLNSNPC